MPTLEVGPKKYLPERNRSGEASKIPCRTGQFTDEKKRGGREEGEVVPRGELPRQDSDSKVRTLPYFTGLSLLLSTFCNQEFFLHITISKKFWIFVGFIRLFVCGNRSLVL